MTFICLSQETRILPQQDNILRYCFRFSYYIAGSGGVGPAMLISCMHLLAEDVVAYDKGYKSYYM